MAEDYEEVAELRAGGIAALTGLARTRTGDTLVAAGDRQPVQPPRPPPTPAPTRIPTVYSFPPSPQEMAIRSGDRQLVEALATLDDRVRPRPAPRAPRPAGRAWGGVGG